MKPVLIAFKQSKEGLKAGVLCGKEKLACSKPWMLFVWISGKVDSETALERVWEWLLLVQLIVQLNKSNIAGLHGDFIHYIWFTYWQNLWENSTVCKMYH